MFASESSGRILLDRATDAPPDRMDKTSEGKFEKERICRAILCVTLMRYLSYSDTKVKAYDDCAHDRNRIECCG